MLIYKKGTLVLLNTYSQLGFRTAGVIHNYHPELDLYVVVVEFDGKLEFASHDDILYAYPADMFDNEKEALTWWLTSTKLNGDPYLTYDRGILSPSVVLNNLPGVSENIRINH